ncbi:MAG: GNAT family N-acetyltransferase [Oleiphilaceae bacterium]|nr:GNAT family N-acetyltransferase [Oleiphilaceae bacterium]
MSNPSLPMADMELAVLLADPRLNNPYHGSEAQKEHDRRDVEQLQQALKRLLGEQRVTYLDDHHRLLDELRRIDPDLVLNFCNAGFRNKPELQMHVPALLEMFGLNFAGADPSCLAICHDKASVNATAANLHVPVPRMELLRLGTGNLPRHYPVFLKPNEGSGSLGISTGSVVTNEQQASRRLAELGQESQATRWVVAEEYLEGPEFSMAVLGSAEPGTPANCLPPVAIDFSQLPEDFPRILTHDAKANQESVAWQRVALVPAKLSNQIREEVENHCVRMFERLGCRDYARFDFRFDAQGTPRLIDANAHPEWGAESMMARMTGFAGLQYEDFLVRIIRSALSRASPGARQKERQGSAPVAEARGICLRATRPEDIDFVRATESAPGNREQIEQWSSDEHLRALYKDDCKHLIIADEQATPVGYAILEGLNQVDQALFLRRIAVAHKGRGIGGRALEAVERYAFEKLGSPCLRLEVHDDNDRALGLYRRHGFEEEGRYCMVKMALQAGKSSHRS